MADPAQISTKEKGKGKGKKGKGKDDEATSKGTKRPAAGDPTGEASGDSSKGPPVGEKKLDRPPPTCSKCGVDPGRCFDNLCPMALDDWQGHLPALCFPCFEAEERGTKEEFDAQAKKMWRARTKNEKQKLRIDSFQKGSVNVELDEGESKKSWRKRVMDAALIIAARWKSSFQKLDPARKEEMSKALDLYRQTRELTAKDPRFVPQLDCCGNK